MALYSKRVEDTRLVSDVVRWIANNDYCYANVPIGESVAVVVGSLLDLNGGTGGASLITNGNEANVDAIALEAATSTGVGNNPTVLALVRGPAVVNASRLALQTDVTVAEAKANLLANIDVVAIEEPTTVVSP